MFTIGALSRRTTTPVDTIRYYERCGLLPKPGRSAGGYRMYGPGDVQRLLFIRRARSLGFSLADIGRLLALAGSPDRPCADVQVLAAAQLDQVRAKRQQLAQLEAMLAALMEACARGDEAPCPIIETLAGMTETNRRDTDHGNRRGRRRKPCPQGA